MALVTGMSVLLYLDRFCIGMAVPRIAAELGLSKFQISAAFSAFFLSYALAQVPTGWLGERLGTRTMLAGSVLAWSLLTGLTGLVSSLAGLIVVRFLMGLSQAGAYPIAARINSLWVPYGQRALANGLVTMGGRAGFALAPVLTAHLILWCNDDWRPAFWLYGLLGVGWVGYFAVKFRNQPTEHAGCNAAEIELIVNSRPPESSNPRGQGVRLPWRVALRSLGLWMQCLAQITSNIAWLFFGTWMPTFLIEQYHLGDRTVGALCSLPPLAGAVGCLLGGIASDRLVRTLGIRWGRSMLGIASKVAAGLFMFLSIFADEPYLATALLVMSAFVNDLGLGATWAYFQDAGGPYVGPLLGFANMFGNLGASASAPLVERVQNAFGWPTAIAVCAGLFVVAGLSWFGIDGSKPMVPEELCVPTPGQHSVAV
jgi:sugar phosphate permease